MGFLGRESKADEARAKAFKVWIRARPSYAIISAAMGVVAVVDAFTLVLGVLAGIGAIILGVKGIKALEQQPQLVGKRLCVTGIVLGCMGILLSGLMWLVIYPWVAQR